MNKTERIRIKLESSFAQSLFRWMGQYGHRIALNHAKEDFTFQHEWPWDLFEGVLLAHNVNEFNSARGSLIMQTICALVMHCEFKPADDLIEQSLHLAPVLRDAEQNGVYTTSLLQNWAVGLGRYDDPGLAERIEQHPRIPDIIEASELSVNVDKQPGPHPSMDNSIDEDVPF